MCVTNWRSWVPKKSMENSLGTNLAMDLDDEDSGVDEDFESLVEDNEDIVERGAIDSQIEPLLSSSQVGSLMHPRPHRRRSVHRRSIFALAIHTG
ncbi:hypothetical protein HK098_004722 [Nowakowskiella sp. JEL0407]|nr:hypothetical protein HK098_004722 [Nowakowskiella sp. JEL0407]